MKAQILHFPSSTRTRREIDAACAVEVATSHRRRVTPFGVLVAVTFVMTMVALAAVLSVVILVTSMWVAR